MVANDMKNKLGRNKTKRTTYAAITLHTLLLSLSQFSVSGTLLSVTLMKSFMASCVDPGGARGANWARVSFRPRQSFR